MPCGLLRIFPGFFGFADIFLQRGENHLSLGKLYDTQRILFVEKL
jgi:hypothetical protein